MSTAFDRNQAVTDLYQALGHKPLNRTWAKAEIFIGLAVAGAGLLTWHVAMPQAVTDSDFWLRFAAHLSLLVFGSYLAMAGHRSHLYQSNNELIAYLVEEIHSLKEKVEPSEHPRR